MAGVVVAQRLEDAQGAEADHIGGVFGLIEGDAHVGLGGEVVHLVGADLLDDAADAGAVAEVAVVKLETLAIGTPSGAQMVDAAGGEARGAPDHPVDLVAFFQEEFGKIGAVLAGDSGDQRDFWHG